jgi:hypothetical protein
MSLAPRSPGGYHPQVTASLKSIEFSAEEGILRLVGSGNGLSSSHAVGLNPAHYTALISSA